MSTDAWYGCAGASSGKPFMPTTTPHSTQHLVRADNTEQPSAVRATAPASGITVHN
jgi:hypothetical protein